MIVMDDTVCMVDVARYFMEFCRDGVVRQVRPLPGRHRPAASSCSTGSRQGEATLDDLDRLERLAGMVQQTSLCGLGQGAPNPVLSTLRYFRDEYLAHIEDRGCPAGVCTICTDGGAGMTTVHTLTHRRRRCRRRRGRDDPGRRPRERHRHPDAVPSRRPVRRSAPAGCAWSRSPASNKLAARPASPRSPRAWRSRTDTERLREYRRMIVEMLFVERNHVCAVCVANGHCELQDLAEHLGRRPRRAAGHQPARSGSTPATRCSSSTTTAASCAPAACGSATRSRAPTPGT